MEEFNYLYNEDCLDAMRHIPDDSVDFLCADLPYGVLNKGNVSAQWDRVIPFEPLWEQFNRICKDNAAMVFFAQGMFTAKLMMSQPNIWRYNLVWDKKRATGFLNSNRMPLRYHEDIVVFYKKMPTYNPQMEDLNGRQPNHWQGYGVHNEKNQCYGKVRKCITENTIQDKKYPRSIIAIPQDHSAERVHPTQKPVSLIRYLIRTFSNPNDVVFDPTMGSGTTCVTAALEHRRYIGIEKEQEYFDIACKRVKEVEENPSLF